MCALWIWGRWGLNTLTPRRRSAPRGGYVPVCVMSRGRLCRPHSGWPFRSFLPRGIFLRGGNLFLRGESWPRSMAGEHLVTHSPWVFSRERGRNAGSRFARRPRYCRTTRSPRVLACAGARGFLRGCLWARVDSPCAVDAWRRGIAGERLATHSPWVLSRYRCRDAGSRFARAGICGARQHERAALQVGA